MPDPIRKRFGYGQLMPLRPACSQNRPAVENSSATLISLRLYAISVGWLWRQLCGIVYARSDIPHPFQFRFSKKAWIIWRKTDPDPILMAWSGFGQTHLVREQAGVQESSGPVSGRTQPARYQFPTFRLGSVLPQTSRIILCNTSLDSI